MRYCLITPEMTSLAEAEWHDAGSSGKDVGAMVKSLLKCDYAEHVRVFFGGKYVSMFVDEDGIAGGLSENPIATDIYHENVRVHDPKQLLDAPSIYGPAVLLNVNLRPIEGR